VSPVTFIAHNQGNQAAGSGELDCLPPISLLPLWALVLRGKQRMDFSMGGSIWPLSGLDPGESICRKGVYYSARVGWDVPLCPRGIPTHCLAGWIQIMAYCRNSEHTLFRWLVHGHRVRNIFRIWTQVVWVWNIIFLLLYNTATLLSRMVFQRPALAKPSITLLGTWVVLSRKFLCAWNACPLQHCHAVLQLIFVVLFRPY
jgi:hypothetical protein